MVEHLVVPAPTPWAGSSRCRWAGRSRQSPGEIRRGFRERAEHMTAIAPRGAGRRAHRRTTAFIRREPLGVVLVLAPWNYPWLSLGERGRARAAGRQRRRAEGVEPDAAGGRALRRGLRRGRAARRRVPACTPTTTGWRAMIGDPRVGFRRLHRIGRAAATPCSGRPRGRFIATGLELGGKDPAYVRADADIDAHGRPSWSTAPSSTPGQSCCGVERIYVHRDVFDDVRRRLRRARRRGCSSAIPLDPTTTLGPDGAGVGGRRSCAARSPRPSTSGARALVDAQRVPGRPRRHGLPRAAGAGRRGPRHAGDDRGDVRARGRRHAGGQRRRGGRADERQRATA